MQNPFEIIENRLSNIEALLIDIKHKPSASSVTYAEPYGDFHWLQGTCLGVPASTLRIKSAAGEIPGVVKFGKRVLYEKATVLNWLRSQTRRASPDIAQIEQEAEIRVNARIDSRQKAKLPSNKYGSKTTPNV